MSFKFPTIKRKDQRVSCLAKDLPSFCWNDLTDKGEIGRGSFGSVFVAKYTSNGAGDTVVIKKLLGAEEEEKRLFFKEAKILHQIQHPNIVQFKGICFAPTAIMLEYLCFDFAQFGIEEKVNSLEQFLHFIDAQDTVDDFPFQQKIADDVRQGISYLHAKGIAHRDLKPANILVTNGHYSAVDSRSEMVNAFMQKPIICKVTDFGESRSQNYQTATICHEATHNVQRGSPAYMAPEIFSGNELSAAATIEDLKAVDIWALGMVFFMLINPDAKYPYAMELKNSNSQEPWRQVVKRKLANGKKPCLGTKYERYQATDWFLLLQAFDKCTHFRASERPSAPEIAKFISGKEEYYSCHNIPLSVNQTTAVMNFDKEVISAGVGLNEPAVIRNDGTNSCAFLTLHIADQLLCDESSPSTEKEWKEFSELVEAIIVTAPTCFNHLRDVSQYYDVLEAYQLLNEERLIARYSISEEMITPLRVFSERGRSALLNAVKKLCDPDDKPRIGLFTCGGYILLVGCSPKEFFIVDTHPVCVELGGNGNGLVKLFQRSDGDAAMSLCAWIWKRLKTSGVGKEKEQSFCILDPDKSSVARCSSPVGQKRTAIFHFENKDSSNLCAEPQVKWFRPLASTMNSSESSINPEQRGPISPVGIDEQDYDCENEKSDDVVKQKGGSKEVLKDIFIGKGQTSAKDSNGVAGSEDSNVLKDGVSNGILDQREADDRREMGKDEPEGRRKQTEESTFPLLHSGSGTLPNSLTNIGWNDKSLHQSDCNDDEVMSVVSSEEDFDVASLPRTKNKQVSQGQKWKRRSAEDARLSDEDNLVEVAEGRRREHVELGGSGGEQSNVISLERVSQGQKRKQKSAEDASLSDEDNLVKVAEGRRRRHVELGGSDGEQSNVISLERENVSSPHARQDPGEYNNDFDLPIFERGKRERYTVREATLVLLSSEEERKCKRTPPKVRKNLSFLVDVSYLKHWDDVKSDMNGTYSKVLRNGTWTLDVNDHKDVEIVQKKKIPLTSDSQLHLNINSKKNAFGLCRSIFVLTDKTGKMLHNTCLLQYHLSDGNPGDVVVFDVQPHGNRKHGNKPFYPTQKSTLEAMKAELTENAPAVAFRRVSNASGGILGARQPEQLPRSREQLYDLKRKSKSGDEVDELLLYAKNKDEPLILEHHDIPEDLWVLGKPHMSRDLSRFCTSEVQSHPMCVDPTFNFGKYEVTPFSYKNLLLRSKRTKEAPVFIGPTALHYSKTKSVYRKIASAVCASCPELLRKGRGYITDGEKALHDALGDTMTKATGLRCFNHFKDNCKSKLKSVGINNKQGQTFFIERVFGNNPNSILEAEDKNQLKLRLSEAKTVLEDEERRITGKDPHFWKYLSKNERMMKSSMVAKARRKAGMPCDAHGKPLRCYTNMAESVNNKLTRQKEAITRKDKSKNNLTKLDFVQNVWEEVDRQQQLELSKAVCGISEEYELADIASYLEVPPEEWFEWSEPKRANYINKFNQMSIEEVKQGKTIPEFTEQHGNQESRFVEFKELPVEEINTLYDTTLSKGLIDTIKMGAEQLLNSPNSVQRLPTLTPAPTSVKYLVAASDSKTGMYECKVCKDHVTCSCPCFKYNSLCKHSLCVAQTVGLLKNHVDHVIVKLNASKRSRSDLVVPAKNAPGKKGGTHNNAWRQRRQENSHSSSTPSNPFAKIHHNNRPLKVCFLSDEMKAIACTQCGKEFPRRQMVIPFDIVLSHEEKWMYPDVNNPGMKLPSSKYTTKFYCVDGSCVRTRFPYFDPALYMETSPSVEERIKDSHKQLLKDQLGLNLFA